MASPVNRADGGRRTRQSQEKWLVLRSPSAVQTKFEAETQFKHLRGRELLPVAARSAEGVGPDASFGGRRAEAPAFRRTFE